MLRSRKALNLATRKSSPADVSLSISAGTAHPCGFKQRCSHSECTDGLWSHWSAWRQDPCLCGMLCCALLPRTGHHALCPATEVQRSERPYLSSCIVLLSCCFIPKLGAKSLSRPTNAVPALDASALPAVARERQRDSETERERERDRFRQTEKEKENRETERQTDRETERHRDRETERQRDRETKRHRDRDSETDRQTDRETERQSDRETESQRDEQREKERERERETETERQRDI